VSESTISNVYLRHFCYLFYKLFREKPREKWLLPYYAFIILLYPIVQELSVKTPSKEEKQRKSAKVNSQWRAEGEQFQRAPFLTRPQLAMTNGRRVNSQWRVKDEWMARSSGEQRSRVRHGEQSTREASYGG